ncbi:MAG: sigma 54-interacting transcriptional regulator [Polyangiaceae bacterium]|nr:sigma 54-interacting transcriptional regulator [Polyangiaceae bacterium]
MQGGVATVVEEGPYDRYQGHYDVATGLLVGATSAQQNGVGQTQIQVRAVPLGEPSERAGWLLLIEAEGAPETEADAPVEFHGMLTRDPAMKRMFRILSRAALSEAPVLVRGETGAGKELVANAVHALSARRNGPFRAINCAALPPTLLESELFGHVRGAFTGAVRDQPGHFALANKGTLFLDEVGELPLDLQAKLLRVIETRSVIPVGARDPVPVDARIVGATHRALRREVEAGRFRADLMYRLRVVPIFLPPLRARKADISLLLQHFIHKRNEQGGRVIERISPSARALLERHPFPGNVRELKNIIEYAFVVGTGPVLVESDLPPEFSEAPGTPEGESETRAESADRNGAADGATSPEAAKILRALERAGGSRERAARTLGLSRVTLWRRMRALGLIK